MTTSSPPVTCWTSACGSAVPETAPCPASSRPPVPGRTILSVPVQRSAGQPPAEVSVQRCAEQAPAGEAGPVPIGGPVSGPQSKCRPRPGDPADSRSAVVPSRPRPSCLPYRRRRRGGCAVVCDRRAVQVRSYRGVRLVTGAIWRPVRANNHLRTGPLSVTPSSYRPPGRYGEPLQILPRFIEQARPTLPATGRALDRIEVQPVRDGSSTHPGAHQSPETTIPGWRLILSDAGRLWASRERPFSQVAAHAGAERTVDGDSLEALRAETDRQETFAREAEEQAAREKEAEEAPAPETTRARRLLPRRRESRRRGSGRGPGR